MPNIGKGGKLVSFDFPLKGYDDNFSNTNQKRGTTRDQLNCLPYDATQGRARGGRRAGIDQLLDTGAGSKRPVQSMLQVTLGQTTDDTTNDPIAACSAPHDVGFVVGGVTTFIPITDAFYDFNHPDGTQLNPALWTVYRGGTAGFSTQDQASIKEMGTTISGQGRACDNGAVATTNAAAILTDASLTMPAIYRVEASMYCSTDTTVGLYLRCSPDNNNWIRFEISGGDTLSIKKRVGGGVVQVLYTQSITLLAGSGNTEVGLFNVVVDGNFFSFRQNFDNTILFETTITDILGAADGGTDAVGFYVEKDSNVSFFPGIQIVRIYSHETSTSQPRETVLVATAGHNVYAGTTSGVSLLGSGGELNGHKPRMSDVAGHVYIVDGTSTLDADLRNSTLTPLVASAGLVPAGCRIAVTWRGRLVLAAPDADPQNVFMSRNGDPTDWLYGQDDALSAVELNASDAGRIGDPVLALIPFRDDTLIIGSDHTIHALHGDPASSDGQLDVVSDSIGILQQEAWCDDPTGTIYFVGTGGFYKMDGGSGAPINISSGRVNDFFAGIDRKSVYVEVEYDRDAYQVWIFVTQINTGQSTHIVYDVTTDSFWRQRLPDNIGPISALVYDGDGPTDRVMLLGGRDGIIRKLNPTAQDDDGAAFTSYVMIGPAQPAGMFDDAMFTQWDIVPGGGTTKLDVYVQVGKDVESAAAAPQQLLASLSTSGRQRKLQRFRGNCFFVYLHNRGEAGDWSMEQLQALAMPAGIVR